MEYTKVKGLPKVELHCHLDGSISPQTFRKIANRQGYPLPEDEAALIEMLQVSKSCQNLAEYLRLFDPVLDCLQEAEALEIAAYDVIAQAAEENVIYIEVRYAPLLSMRNGLSCDAVIEAILRGLAKGEQDFGVKAGALLCGMRHHSEERNHEVVISAQKYLNHGVAGIDLAGNETDFPPARFEDFLALGRHYHVPITLHAGECGCAENVHDSVLLGAQRIGHGIAIKNDPEIMQICVEHNVLLEMCPTSNLQTKAVASMEKYPFQQFLDAQIKISINTDNRTVSATTLTDEYMLLDTYYDCMDYSLMEKLNLMALEAAFTDDACKKRLAAVIREAYQAIED